MNTEDEWIELTAAASTQFYLKRVRISCNTPNSDANFTPRICLMSSAGASGASYTPIKKKLLSPAATTTCKVKNAATAFTLGSITSTYHQDNVNCRAIWEWIPRGDEELISSGSAGIIAILGKCSAVSTIFSVVAEFEE